MGQHPRLEAILTLKDQAKNGHIAVRRSDQEAAKSKMKAAFNEAEKARLEYLKYEMLYFRMAIFGSARLDKDTSEFQFIRDLSRALVEDMQIDIVTGGGPGIMKAANRGLRDAELAALERGDEFISKNRGLPIELPWEEVPNQDLHFATRHLEFSTRLQQFIDMIDAAYNAPGGIGTLLEMSLLTQLRQVQHLESSFPILAHPAWTPVIDAWNDTMYHQREKNKLITTISASDLNLIQISEDISEIVAAIRKRFDVFQSEIGQHVRIID